MARRSEQTSSDRQQRLHEWVRRLQHLFDLECELEAELANVRTEIVTHNVRQMHERLDTARAGLQTRLDPERKKAALAEVLAPFRKGGPFAYVPAREGRIPAEKQWLARENQQAAFDLYRLGRAIRDIEPALVQIKAESMRPLGNEEALLIRSKQSGCSLEMHLQIQQLDEQRRQRLVPELRAAAPAEVARRYTEALQDRTHQLNCTLVAVVEELHGNGWSGRELTPEELPAVQQLRRAIREARQQRIPDDVRELEALLEQVKVEESRAGTLHRIVPLNPDLVRPLPDDDEE